MATTVAPPPKVDEVQEYLKLLSNPAETSRRVKELKDLQASAREEGKKTRAAILELQEKERTWDAELRQRAAELDRRDAELNAKADALTAVEAELAATKEQIVADRATIDELRAQHAKDVEAHQADVKALEEKHAHADALNAKADEHIAKASAHFKEAQDMRGAVFAEVNAIKTAANRLAKL